MPTIPSYGSTAQPLTVANLHSLGDGNYWNSSAIGNTSTSAVWVDIQVRLVTTATVGDSEGFADVFIAGSADQTNFAGGVNSTEGTFSGNPSSSEQSRNMDFMGRVVMPSDDTSASTFTKIFRTAPFDVYKDFVILINNESGAALASTGNAVSVLKNQVSSTA